MRISHDETASVKWPGKIVQDHQQLSRGLFDFAQIWQAYFGTLSLSVRGCGAMIEIHLL